MIHLFKSLNEKGNQEREITITGMRESQNSWVGRDLEKAA